MNKFSIDTCNVRELRSHSAITGRVLPDAWAVVGRLRPPDVTSTD